MLELNNYVTAGKFFLVIAGELIAIFIVSLFLMLLGFQVTAVYVGVTFLGAMLTAAILSRLGLERDIKPLAAARAGCCCEAKPDKPSAVLQTAPVDGGRCCCGTTASVGSTGAGCCAVDLDANASVLVPFKVRMQHAGAEAVSTFKGVFWYLMIGAGIGAFIYGFFPQDLVVRVAGPGNPWSIPIAAALGIPMYIRAETVIPIGTALIEKGMGVGTVPALVIGGAGASIPEIIILGSIFKRRLIVAFCLTVFVTAVAAGYLVDLLGIAATVF